MEVTQEQTASEWAKIVILRWQANIEKEKLIDTRKLIDSFKKDVVSQANGDVQKITFIYAFYGMFQDMGVGRGTGVEGVKENTTSRRLEGKRRGNVRRARKWYSKTLTAETFRLSELMGELYGNRAIAAVTENIAGEVNINL